MSYGEATVEVADAIEALRDADGVLTPEAVIEAARDPASPLHGHFEWQDAKASALYRLGQARALIRSCKIPFQIGPASVAVVTYVPTPRTVGAYQRLDEIQPRSDTAKDVVLVELARVSTALDRARKIAAVVNLDHEIEELLDMVIAARHRIEAVSDAEAA